MHPVAAWRRFGILSPARRKVIRSALLEFLVHGLKYVFPIATGAISRGMPTGYAANPLKELFLSAEGEPVPVWPDPQGTVRGLAVEPLYKTVTSAAKKDHRLYDPQGTAEGVNLGLS